MDLTPELVNMTGHEGFLPLNHLLDESDRIRIPTHLVSEIVSPISAIYSAILIGKWNRRLWIPLTCESQAVYRRYRRPLFLISTIELTD